MGAAVRAILLGGFVLGFVAWLNARSVVFLASLVVWLYLLLCVVWCGVVFLGIGVSFGFVVLLRICGGGWGGFGFGLW